MIKPGNVTIVHQPENERMKKTTNEYKYKIIIKKKMFHNKVVCCICLII